MYLLLIIFSIFINSSLSFNFIHNKQINAENIINAKSMKFNLYKDSLWLSYPIKINNLKDISSKIPNTHRLSKCKVFKEDKLDYRLFFNFFQVQSSFFTGNRLEIVTIVNNILNGTTSFVIIDCFSDVMSWDPIEGIQKANCKIDKKITNSKYNVKIKTNNKYEILNLNSFKTKIKKRVLREFSINPNYVCYFKNYKKGYNLVFNEKQIDKKVILLKDVKLNHDIYKNYIKELEYAFIYPQEMNFKVYLE
jgi:hypothetical protein